MKKIVLGNEGIARGAYEAGVRLASAYPGTPSTEITELISNYPEIYTEWSPNEKVAFEVAIGASVAGARAMVSMKHVGLNVAADPLFTASYTGVNAGLVCVVADDPSMHSSQNEQDSRYYALSALVPMLEPSDSNEAKEFVKLAYELSEKYDAPVLIRTTTRLSHSQSFVEFSKRQDIEIKPYKKDVFKYAMMPAFAKARHIVVEEKMDKLGADCNSFAINKIEMAGKKVGVICSGIVYQYIKEAMPEVSILKLGMVNPLPMQLIEKFAKSVDELIIAEELEPIIETQVKAYGIKCKGKEIFSRQGELSVAIIREKIFGEKINLPDNTLPNRPPVMCAGCPHRSVFYVLNKMGLVVNADIGCYTLGAQPPLSAVDTVVCMGASIGMAHGYEKALGKDRKKNVAVIGDSTFVHSGITGIIDAVYNKGTATVIILDNSTTGMTGHQDNPATGKTIRNEQTHQLDLEAVCRACGVESVRQVDAYDMVQIEKVLQEELAREKVSVIIAKRPCILLDRGVKPLSKITDKCKRCKACLKIGCPAIVNNEDGSIVINPSICNGCGICKGMCKFDAIVKGER